MVGSFFGFFTDSIVDLFLEQVEFSWSAILFVLGWLMMINATVLTYRKRVMVKRQNNSKTPSSKKMQSPEKRASDIENVQRPKTDENMSL